MPDMLHSVLLILVIAAVTALLRFLPFILFPPGKQTPGFIVYLSKVLPYSIIGMLVVYCLKNVSLFSAPFGIPELIAVALVVGTYLYKRNTLISIAAGTICYMLLVQLVFV